jgi:8-oxo-dGTP diphosphatase
VSAEPRTVRVAVGIVTDAAGAILITRRPDHVHQGGLWEFPGGKVETEETVAAALRRELHEELGIVIQAAEPLLRVRHPYPDKTVVLDAWRVTAYHGEPYGREGQPLVWALPETLADFAFPAADEAIITRLREERDQMAQQASSKATSTVLWTARRLGSCCSRK